MSRWKPQTPEAAAAALEARGGRTPAEYAAYKEGLARGSAAAIAHALNVADPNVSLWVHHLFLHARKPSEAEISAVYDAADQFAAAFYARFDKASGDGPHKPRRHAVRPGRPSNVQG